MKIVKSVLIVLGIVIATPLLLALFIKNDYSIERSIIINKPKAEVFSYIKYLRNQDNYSAWSQIDPNVKKTYTGTDGMVGFISAWESDHPEVGVGEQELIYIEEGVRVDFELRFKEPFEGNSPAYLLTQESGAGKTKVIWGFKGHMDYPTNIMLPVLGLEDALGKDFEAGLQKLKEILEAQ